MWYHVRLRIVILAFSGVALWGWFIYRLIKAGHNDPFDDPLTWTALVSVILWHFLLVYSVRFSVCPECGHYALGEEGSFFFNFLKTMFSQSRKTSYWEVCRNCGHRTWYEDELDY